MGVIIDLFLELARTTAGAGASARASVRARNSICSIEMSN